MKSDLDALMRANQLDALWVMGSADHNPAMVYLTGGGHLTRADLIKKAGQTGILFHGMMERDEAAKTGLETRSISFYPTAEMFRAAGGDFFKAGVLRYRKMLEDAGVTKGRVALYGALEFGPVFSTLNALAKELPGLELVGYQEKDILSEAMLTKDAAEIERICRMGRITTTVVGRTADFLTGHKARDGALVKSNGDFLTIGEVKSRINLWLAELGAENPEGTIFSIGRDAGVPHSSGKPEDLLRLGQTIVYDIFPCEQGGGYYYDFTRTWCLGYAPDDVQALYEQVNSVYDQVFAAFKVNESFRKYQHMTCDLLEGMGHPTVQSDPMTEVGYIHSLGHGLGLKVHERPSSGSASQPGDVLKPGVVATIEPGLYYPDRGMGVRLENTFYITGNGQFIVPAPYPMDLVLPVQQV
jgi:Xaa-Pro aminopeptidase